MAQDDTSGRQAVGIAGSLTHLGRLSAWIAHEVNNSLGGIHNSFVLLQRLIPTDHPHFRYVAAIEHEIARSTALTRRLQQGYAFDLARDGELPLASALARNLEILRPLAEARKLDITSEPRRSSEHEPRCAPLASAAIRLLLQHAIECSAEGGVLRVRNSFEDGLMVVSVSSLTGTTTPGQGPLGGPPGLALTLLRDLIDSLDGARFHERSTGQGSDMSITLRPNTTKASRE